MRARWECVASCPFLSDMPSQRLVHAPASLCKRSPLADIPVAGGCVSSLVLRRWSRLCSSRSSSMSSRMCRRSRRRQQRSSSSEERRLGQSQCAADLPNWPVHVNVTSMQRVRMKHFQFGSVAVEKFGAWLLGLTVSSAPCGMAGSAAANPLAQAENRFEVSWR